MYSGRAFLGCGHRFLFFLAQAEVLLYAPPPPPDPAPVVASVLAGKACQLYFSFPRRMLVSCRSHISLSSHPTDRPSSSPVPCDIPSHPSGGGMGCSCVKQAAPIRTLNAYRCATERAERSSGGCCVVGGLQHQDKSLMLQRFSVSIILHKFTYA